jgi:hypothetical protein
MVVSAWGSNAAPRAWFVPVGDSAEMAGAGAAVWSVVS